VCAETPVWANFAQCEAKGHAKGKAKRERIFAKLQTALGQTIEFSRAARAAIDPDLIAELEALNWMDAELHRLATALHAETLERQRREGRYQDLEERMRRRSDVPLPPGDPPREEL